MNRREFVRSLLVTAALVGTAAVGLVELGDLASVGQNSQQALPTVQQSSSTLSSQIGTLTRTVNSTSTTQSLVSSIPDGYSFVASLNQLSGKTFAYFTHPTYGNSILVIVNGLWKAFSATCTHRPCTVQYQSSVIYCPCHAGTFSPVDGSVESGPPPSPLPEYAVLIQENNLYVGNSRIN